MSLNQKKLGEIGDLLQELLIQESGDPVVPYVLVVMPLAKAGSPLMGDGGYVSNIDPADAARELRRTADYLDGQSKKEMQDAIAEAANATKQ